MAIYKNRNPFMSRVGQFEPSKHTLVVGVLNDVLFMGKADATFYMTMGTSKTVYRQTYGKLRDAKHTMWKNPSGKMVRIIPVSEFIIEKSKEQIKKVEAEPTTEELAQAQLDWFRDLPPSDNPKDAPQV